MRTNEARENEENPALQCKHDTIFDEQIGIYCRWCGWIHTEIKYITPQFVSSLLTLMIVYRKYFSLLLVH